MVAAQFATVKRLRQHSGAVGPPHNRAAAATRQADLARMIPEPIVNPKPR